MTDEQLDEIKRLITEGICAEVDFEKQLHSETLEKLQERLDDLHKEERLVIKVYNFKLMQKGGYWKQGNAKNNLSRH